MNDSKHVRVTVLADP